VLEQLRLLIPCDDLGYQEANVEARCFTDPEAPAHVEEDALYWAVGPCPITEYRIRTGDLAAIRMSDVVGRRRFRELPVYRDFFQPRDMQHMLDLGFSSATTSFRSLILFRGHDVPDFAERERAILELLRPHFRAREARATLLALVAGRMQAQDDGESAADLQLTPREREIVTMVASGKTNAQIATDLWVSPATVKKHLENVYLKLGVGSRAAAAMKVSAQHSAG